jgi:hypothetical protein
MEFDVFEFPVGFHSFFDLGDKGRYKVSVQMTGVPRHYGSYNRDTNEVIEVEVAVMNPEGDYLPPKDLPVNGSLDKFHSPNDGDLYAYVPVEVVKGFLKRLKREQRKAQERRREKQKQALR